MATSGLKNPGSICPQLAPGPGHWSVTVESPKRYTVGTCAGSTVTSVTVDAHPGASNVSASSQSGLLSSSTARRTAGAPDALGGGGGKAGVLTLTMKRRSSAS